MVCLHSPNQRKGKMQQKRRLRLTTRLFVFVVSSWILFIGTGALCFMSTTSQAAFFTTADGSALYGSKCAICHGKNGTGTPAWRAKGQPDLSSSDWQRTRSDEQIATRIREGKGKMPGFGKKLSEEEVVALVKQVRTFRK